MGSCLNQDLQDSRISGILVAVSYRQSAVRRRGLETLSVNGKREDGEAWKNRREKRWKAGRSQEASVKQVRGTQTHGLCDWGRFYGRGLQFFKFFYR